LDALGRLLDTLAGGTHTQYVYTGGVTAVMNGITISSVRVPEPGGAVFVHSGTDIRYSPDWQGSMRFGSTYGNVARSQAYAPFGENYARYNVSYGNGAQDFATIQNDVASDLYNAAFRQLHPSQGRWISPDRSGAVNFANPQTWNRYAYVLNNPLSYADPLGLFCVWDNGSYDSNDDPASGNKGACEDQLGGTWFNGSPSDWNPNAGDWSGQADQQFAAWAQGINPSVADWGTPTGTPDASAFGTFTPVATTTSSLPGQISLGCMLQAPSGSYTLGSNAVALFQPPMTNALNAAFGNLNSQGVVPMAARRRADGRSASGAARWCWSAAMRQNQPGRATAAGYAYTRLRSGRNGIVVNPHIRELESCS
jgi:RHS repeat-associated protein